MNILNEITRKNLVGKSKKQSPDRYNRRLGYTPKSYKGIDTSRLFNDDIIIIQVPVGDYICTVAFKGMLEHLKAVVDKQPTPKVTLQSVIRAMNIAIDDTDLLVDCTCADFKYRFAYWATKYGYKYGKPETRPSKITNPNDKLGAMCKHLDALLGNKKWVTKVASTFNSFIKENEDKVRKALGVSEDEFKIVKPSKIPKGSKFNKQTKKYELPKKDDEVKNSEADTFSNEPDKDDEESKFKNKPVSDRNDFKQRVEDQDDSDEELELNDEESEE